MGYDIPVIQKLYDIDLSPKKQLDTMLLSKIVFQDLYAYDIGIKGMTPKLFGKYSLEAFGERFGEKKLDYDDWSKLTEEMLVYCKRDVAITARLMDLLLIQDNYPSEEVILLENKVKRILTIQELMGFPLDLVKAQKLRDSLLLEQFNINKKLQKIFRPMFLHEKSVDKPTKPINRKKFLPNEKYISLLGTQ